MAASRTTGSVVPTTSRLPRWSWALAFLAILGLVGVWLASPASGRPGAGQIHHAHHDAPAALPLPGPPAGDGYEIWLPDQGTNTIHIYDPQLREIDRVEFGPEVVRPHMIDFDSQGRYAFVANPVSGNVAVIRTADREVVAVVPTGPGTHMARVTPDDSAAWVAVIGGQRFSEIPLDLDAAEPTFAVGRVINTAEALADAPFTYPSAGAVCHDYTADSRFAYLTFGPGSAQGGVVVVDLDAATFVRFYDPAVVKANCGVERSPDGRKMYANWGGDVASDTQGEWYVFDTATHDLLRTESSRGVDAHGVRATPDGNWLLMVNRATSNGLIINPRTDKVVRELSFVGESPDIIDYSPDSRYAFISLRGPNPLSGPHAIAGDTPGFAVLHMPSGRLLTIVQHPCASTPTARSSTTRTASACACSTDPATRTQLRHSACDPHEP